MDINGIIQSVCIGVMLVLLGALGYTQMWLWRTGKTQRELQMEIDRTNLMRAETQREVAALTAKIVAMGGDWRVLSPEARQQVRQAMVEIIAEIDAEPAPTRH